MLIGNIEIAYGQQLIHTDCKGIHYTDNQDKRALECLINTPKKDSLIDNLSLQIINFKEITSTIESKSSSFETHYNEEKEIAKKLQADLKRSRSWNSKLLIGGPLVGLFIGVLMSN